MDVSHRNADKLDNRRDNLEVSSRADNQRNHADGPTAALRSNPYRGVTRDGNGRALNKVWRGKTTYYRKRYQTRRYATPEEARDALAELREELDRKYGLRPYAAAVGPLAGGGE